MHQKKNDISFSKAKTKFCLSFHYSSDNSYLFVNGKEIYEFKTSNEIVNFPSQEIWFRWFRRVLFKGNVYDFSVDYGSIEKSDILDTHKYLMTNNNIK